MYICTAELQCTAELRGTHILLESPWDSPPFCPSPVLLNRDPSPDTVTLPGISKYQVHFSPVGIVLLYYLHTAFYIFPMETNNRIIES